MPKKKETEVKVFDKVATHLRVGVFMAQKGAERERRKDGEGTKQVGQVLEKVLNEALSLVKETM